MNKTVLITGATSGIGYATANAFAEEGCNLILTGRRAERLKSLKKEIEERCGVEVAALSFDIRDRYACKAAIESLPEKFRTVDILVNNAGLASGLEHINEGDISDWEAMIDTNVKGLLYITRIVSNMMIRQGGGHIINLGSIAGTQPYENGSVYCASKHAVHALSQTMRIDLLSHGIRVTSARRGHSRHNRMGGIATRAYQYRRNRDYPHAAGQRILYVQKTINPSAKRSRIIKIRNSKQRKNMSIEWFLIIVIGVVGLIVQARLQYVFNKYSRVMFPGGLTGREVAEKMLRDNGITDVTVTSTSGHLTDHYNPQTRTVNLSQSVYGSNSVAAAAVAAHECGHAVQDAVGYAPLRMRSALVPAIQFSSTWSTWVIVAGILVINTFPYLFWAGIAMIAVSALFSIVTLPVEYNASARAMKWLESSGTLQGQSLVQARTALSWAARTYLVAALSAIATLLYYLSIARRNS